MRDMYKLRRIRSREQQHNRSLTDAPSFLLCTHLSPPTPHPLLWSFSEELSPAQWHVDVYNGDGWWLAPPHRGTDGLLPKRLSASLHQSPSDSPPGTQPRLNIGLLRCVSVCVCARALF